MTVPQVGLSPAACEVACHQRDHQILSFGSVNLERSSTVLLIHQKPLANTKQDTNVMVHTTHFNLG